MRDLVISMEIPNKLRPLVGFLERLDGRATLDELQGLLESLDVTRDDLEPFCVFSESGYKRNRVAHSAWYDLIVLCWRSGQGSHIHDHAGSACSFKVIEGVVTETGFSLIEDQGTDGKLVEPTLSRDFPAGSVCVAADGDIHQVVNRQGEGRDLVTVHVYSPLLEMTTYELAPYVRLAGGGSGRFVEVHPSGRTVRSGLVGR